MTRRVLLALVAVGGVGVGVLAWLALRVMRCGADCTRCRYDSRPR